MEVNFDIYIRAFHFGRPVGKEFAMASWTHGLSCLRTVAQAAAPIVTHGIP
jgi:hypothetical protein